MARTPEEILKDPYARVLTPAENGTYTAEIMEFPGCVTEGDTAQEALANLHEAAVLWLEDVLEQGIKVPEPAALEQYAGKIALRLPRSLHRKCVQLAEKEDVSLNQFLVAAVSARVGSEDLYKRIVDTLQERLVPTTRINIHVDRSFLENFGLARISTRGQITGKASTNAFEVEGGLRPFENLSRKVTH